jgi:hypothetical protein
MNLFLTFSVRGVKRISRTCGYEGSNNICYKTNGGKHGGGYDTIVCTCNMDGCNAATATAKVGSVAALLILGAVMAIAFR